MSSSTQENMCRFHVVWSIGLIEPGLLLTVLFLVQGSLQEIPRNINNRILLFSALLCFPVFIIQFSLAAAGYRLSSRGLLPSYFTRPYKVIEYEDNDQIILCSYSLLSLLALALFTLIFIWFFAQFGYRIVCHVINRKLRRRIYWLLVSVIVLLPLHVVLLGVTVKIDPSRTIHEVLTFTGFLALLFCVATALGVLVFLPIADAIDAHYSFRRRNWSWQSFRASPIEPFGRPSLTGLSDNEDPMNQGGSSLLLGALSSTDVGSSSREASLTFDTTVKELTLGPGGWLVDIPGSIAYPSSPVFPERPLTLI
ncbi:hypothetical protein KP509_33G042700 [Ceratopteris richardii]|nr:hypothetical protein KP509_33G042700 [Ceratopteris richardii]